MAVILTATPTFVTVVRSRFDLTEIEPVPSTCTTRRPQSTCTYLTCTTRQTNIHPLRTISCQTMSNSKRTRSQLLLPQFDFDIGRSPLKDARMAIRNHRESLETVAVPSSNDNDGTLVSSAKSASKRPSSPTKNAELLRERELKRAKFSRIEAENSVTQASSSNNVQLTHKPSSMSSVDARKPDITLFSRSRSVPLSSSGWMPHIDLNMVPPSPSKKVKLRIASVPPLASVPDIDCMQVDQPEPPTVVVTLAEDRPLSPFLREPSSDLTPPPSSSPLRATLMQAHSARESSPIPLSPTPVSARLPSRLPRPSSSANLVPSRVPVKRPRGTKSKAAAPVVPRMTRARKRESDEKAREAETLVGECSILHSRHISMWYSCANYAYG